MPRRRRHREPDTRLDWRDPHMPVLRAMDTGIEELSPESETEYAQMIMAQSTDPKWDRDPTYNLAKRHRGKRL